jgi:hypothetical protein
MVDAIAAGAVNLGQHLLIIREMMWLGDGDL